MGSSLMGYARFPTVAGSLPARGVDWTILSGGAWRPLGKDAKRFAGQSRSGFLTSAAARGAILKIRFASQAELTEVCGKGYSPPSYRGRMASPSNRSSPKFIRIWSAAYVGSSSWASAAPHPLSVWECWRSTPRKPRGCEMPGWLKPFSVQAYSRDNQLVVAFGQRLI
jgi:hypothetical protein